MPALYLWRWWYICVCTMKNQFSSWWYRSPDASNSETVPPLSLVWLFLPSRRWYRLLNSSVKRQQAPLPHTHTHTSQIISRSKTMKTHLQCSVLHKEALIICFFPPCKNCYTLQIQSHTVDSSVSLIIPSRKSAWHDCH